MAMMRSHTLTDREARVIELLSRGMSQTEVGAQLGVAKQTVDRAHAAALRRLVCAAPRADRARILATRGLSPSPSGSERGNAVPPSRSEPAAEEPAQ